MWPFVWKYRKCVPLTIPVLNHLLLKVIVRAAWMRSVANVLRLSPQSQLLWGLLWKSFSLQFHYRMLTMRKWLLRRERGWCWGHNLRDAIWGYARCIYMLICNLHGAGFFLFVCFLFCFFLVQLYEGTGMQRYWFMAWQCCPSVAAD